LLAFSALVDQVKSGEDGYALARPLVFEAHHVTELALKARTLRHDAAFQSELPPSGHDLRRLLVAERARNGERSDSSAWEDAFVSMLDAAWQAGRYPVGVGGLALHDEWCCFDAEALSDAVLTFLHVLTDDQRPSP
jgi:hypothetical protein